MIPWRRADELLHDQALDIDQGRNLLGIRLLATFGETGWFGGLAPVSGPEEGSKYRVAPEARSLHAPPCGSRALHPTKTGQEPECEPIMPLVCELTCHCLRAATTSEPGTLRPPCPRLATA